MSAIEILLRWWPAFARGAATTLVATMVACTCGTALGCALGWVESRAGKRSRWWRIAIRAPQEAVRAIPVLVLLVWLHYLLPSTFGITPSPFLTTAIVLTAVVMLSSGEVIRSAITSIPAAEVEAALMLGLTRSEVVRRISMPLALRASTPSLLLLYADTLKLSTFASVIALGELLHTTDVIIQQTYLAVPAYTALAVIFLATIVPLNLSAQSLARRWAYRR